MTTTIAWISAHPDDETFGAACTMMEAARRGLRPVLLCATDGDAGKTGYLGPMTKAELAVCRQEELRRACALMDVAELVLLHHPDGRLPEVPRAQLVQEVADFLNAQQAQVAVSFGEDGMTGHRDHVALHHAVREAVLGGRCPTVRKLYYYHNPYLEKGPAPSVTVNVARDWPRKAEALLAHESQRLTVERIFGDLTDFAGRLPTVLVTERFVLAWEDGKPFPGRSESFLADGLEAG